ncbi:MAG: maleylacetate reductase [Bacteroidota bacterium]
MTFNNFTYSSFERRVYFGVGKVDLLPGLLKAYQRPFLITGSSLRPYAEALIRQVAPKPVVLFDEVIQHVPIQLVNKALAQFNTQKADVLVAMGGGSTIGLAKAIVKEVDMPIIAVPSTYSGSEMTNIWGIRGETGKTTGRMTAVLPKIVVYDPQLSLRMPLSLAATSAMNAMAHLIEALYAVDGNPMTYHQSLLGMKTLVEGMTQLAQEQALSLEANEQLLLGASLAGAALAEVSMALHHKTAHVLGGSFGMDHSKVHSVMQSYVLDYQWPFLSTRTQSDFQEVFQHEKPALQLRELSKAMGNPTTLEEINFRREDIPAAVEIMLQNPYPNPAPLSELGLTTLLTNAYAGILA